MEGLTAFFLGVIAVCMVIITVGMVGIFIVLFGILRNLRELLIELKIDYKVLSPKVHQIVENVENTTSLLKVFNILKRKKRR